MTSPMVQLQHMEFIGTESPHPSKVLAGDAPKHDSTSCTPAPKSVLIDSQYNTSL